MLRALASSEQSGPRPDRAIGLKRHQPISTWSTLALSTIREAFVTDEPIYTSQLPAKAVSKDGGDLVVPVTDLLRALSLLPKQGEFAGPGAAFKGTPDSVSVIESGATALSKGWAAGGGVAILSLWASVGGWWIKQSGDIQVGVLWAAALASVALVLGLAYIVGSDVRGRALATVATLEARAAVAQSFIREAAALYTPDLTPTSVQIIAISPPQPMKWIARQASDESGWIASASRFQGDETKYWLSKGAVQQWVDSSEVALV